MPRKAIFLDRDGVINTYVYNSEFGTVDSPKNPEEFKLAPGAGDAIAQFNRLNYLVIVVSNQPGIAKGKFSPALLERINAKMHADIGSCGGKLDAVYYCLHHPFAALPAYRTRCECRKPRPGMLLSAAQDWGVDLQHAFMIGDGIVDIEAGCAAGIRTVFVGDSKPYTLAEFEKRGVHPDFTVSTLKDAVEVVRYNSTVEV